MKNSFGATIMQLALQCHKIANRIGDASGLSVHELQCLLQIHLERPCCVRQLTELLGTTPTSTSKLLRALDRHGYIVRSLNTQDRRMEHVVLSEAGVAKALTLITFAEAEGSRLLVRIPTERVSAFIECVAMLSAAQDELTLSRNPLTNSVRKEKFA